jgi:hypothetical protein
VARRSPLDAATSFRTGQDSLINWLREHGGHQNTDN